jgi:hypothetical protein
MNELDTCDWLTDYYKFFRSPDQIRATLESLNLEVKSCALGGNGVEARARVPMTANVKIGASSQQIATHA